MLIPNATAMAAEGEAEGWKTLAPMATPRQSLQTEIINGKIYAVGGHNTTSGFQSSLEVYNTSTDTWTPLASMSTVRFRFCSEVIGGETQNSILNSVEVYDPSTNKWTSLTPMSSRRNLFQTEVIDGKIYAIGGMASSVPKKILSTAEVYDPSTDTWTILDSMSEARYALQTEIVYGKIYAIGGNGLSSAEVYDPSTNSWTTLPSMTKDRRLFQTQVIDGVIYAIGGYGNGEYLSSVEAYKVTSSSTNTKQLKVVLEINETLQLSIANNLSQNTSVTWSSSDASIASVDTTGVVKALAPSDTVITATDGGAFTESINVLVLQNAQEHRLAVDLKVGDAAQLTVADNVNTEAVTWASSDSLVATVSPSGKVTAASTGLTLVNATDADANEIGQVYVRVRA